MDVDTLVLQDTSPWTHFSITLSGVWNFPRLFHAGAEQERNCGEWKLLSVWREPNKNADLLQGCVLEYVCMFLVVGRIESFHLITVMPLYSITTSPVSPSFVTVIKSEKHAQNPGDLGAWGWEITPKPSRRVSNSNSYWHSRFPHLSALGVRKQRRAPCTFRVRKVNTVRSRWCRGDFCADISVMSGGNQV